MSECNTCGCNTRVLEDKIYWMCTLHAPQTMTFCINIWFWTAIGSDYNQEIREYLSVKSWAMLNSTSNQIYITCIIWSEKQEL